NQIARIGRYGNPDDGAGAQPPGPKGENPQPSTHNPQPVYFAWPANVDAADGLIAVADSANRRIAVIRLVWAAEETVGVK
ncbi:MAG TPA: hypothetical protein PK280_09465, partial [Planctomycetota bacterium]|nr:hypothetical protein [Planctomycetota bacterium]